MIQHLAPNAYVIKKSLFYEILSKILLILLMKS